MAPALLPLSLAVLSMFSMFTATVWLGALAVAIFYDRAGYKFFKRREFDAIDVPMLVVLMPFVSAFSGAIIGAGVNWITDKNATLPTYVLAFPAYILDSPQLAEIAETDGVGWAIGCMTVMNGLVALIYSTSVILSVISRKDGLLRTRISISRALLASKNGDVTEGECALLIQEMKRIYATGARLKERGHSIPFLLWLKGSLKSVAPARKTAAIVLTPMFFLTPAVSAVAVEVGGTRAAIIATAFAAGLMLISVAVCPILVWRLYRRRCVTIGSEIERRAGRAREALVRLSDSRNHDAVSSAHRTAEFNRRILIGKVVKIEWRS